MSAANERATQVARSSYGKLLAMLATFSGDIMAAEDALADAFRIALETWPEKGAPDNPEAWLLTVSRNRLRDTYRSAAHRTRLPIEDERVSGILMADADPAAIPDERLKLLFVCGHPAIDPKIRTPLMLQAVLGLDAEAIGSAFLVPASAMAQRLVRAKRKILEARIPFAVPERGQMPGRLGPVLEAIYGAYAADWDATPCLVATGDDLGGEALFLADLLATLLPGEAEALGLAALLSFSCARAGGRISADGGFVPLDEQDAEKWDGRRIARGEMLLRKAHELGRIGRFQIEAAIQSVHCMRKYRGSTDWRGLSKLYEGLMVIAPTVGSAVGRAAAVGRAYGPQAGLDVLACIDQDVRERFQPAWVTLAHLLEMQGEDGQAIVAYDRAIAITTQPHVRRFLDSRRRRLAGR